MIIPEIDMPGHATAANRAYPEYNGGGEGILNVSWGANQSFANMALNTLQDYGFRQIYR